MADHYALAEETSIKLNTCIMKLDYSIKDIGRCWHFSLT